MTETAATRRSAVELLAQGVGLLDSGHFRELGLSQRAIEAVWRNVPVVEFPDFARPLVPSRPTSPSSRGARTATAAAIVFVPRGGGSGSPDPCAGILGERSSDRPSGAA